MKAVILVGGEGTRLRPLTCNIAKAMVPVLNRPFLEYLFRYLRQHDIREIILAANYLPTPLKSYFGDGSRLDVRLTYIVEDQPLGTAGAIKNTASRLDETFLVVNGDILTGIDLTAMLARHRSAGPRVSIALTPVDNPTAFGVVETGDGGEVKAFVEKPRPEQITTNMVNAGIYIMEPDVLDHIPAAEPSMVERHLFPHLLETGEPMLGYPSQAYWIDIGTPEKYIRVQHDLLSGKAPSLSLYHAQVSSDAAVHPAAHIGDNALIGEGCTVAKGARIEGPAVLGAGCQVGEDASVTGAVVWHHTQIGGGAVLRNCVVASGCDIQENSQVLDNCVLGDNVVVTRGRILDGGEKVWPDNSV